MDEHDVAVIQFSGFLSDDVFKTKEGMLRELCQREAVELDADPSNVKSAAYNPPWCLPFLRTNEVHIPVKYSSG